MSTNPPPQFLASFPSRIDIGTSSSSQYNHHQNISPVSSTSPILDSKRKGMAPPTIAPTEDKAKRLTACLVCRKRKLKCDSGRPKCASCTRLGHACGYEETRKKSGPKQGYVKKLEQKSQTLEQRLAQLEKLLASHQQQQSSSSPSLTTPLPTPPVISPLPFENLSTSTSATNTLNQFTFHSTSPTSGINPNDVFTTQPMFPDLTPPDSTTTINIDSFSPLFRHDSSADQHGRNQSNADPLGNFAWDMVSLGIQEEFPPEELTNKLTEIYFDRTHHMLPFLHRARFMAALHLPTTLGVPAPLRYIVWALGAASSDDLNLRAYKEVLYTRARRSLNDLLETTLDSLKPHRISTLQAIILVTMYEFIHANFGQAWMNCGRAGRMGVYFNLMRLDEPHLVCKQTLVEERDWIDHEERRRTFWAAFMLDRFASLGTGWAATLNEEDITTFLPGPEEEYQAGTGQVGENTGEYLYPSSKSSMHRKKIGTMAAIVRVAAFLGRVNAHVNRPNHEKDYMTRHRELDNLLATIQFSIPQNLKYILGSNDASLAFLQNLLSVSTVLLSQAALYKSQLTELPVRLSDLAARCHMGAVEIARTIRASSNLPVTRQCSYNAFCIYVGSRVFVEMLRQPAPTSPPASGPSREDLQGDLNMLLAALQTYTEHVPLAGHFLMQLEADLHGLEKVVSIRPYDVNVGYGDCNVLQAFTNEGAAKAGTTKSEDACSKSQDFQIPTEPIISSTSTWGYSTTPHQPFDMRGMDRINPLDTSGNSSFDFSSREGSLTSASIQPISSDSSPDMTTPESIRQFDPDKFFGDINLTTGGIDVVMNMGQDDPSVEFFTEMLAGNMNGN